jgi:glyoxylate/hydroxypyruvate reductase A
LYGGAPGGYIINVARGQHLIEDDLIPLLDAGRLAGATLDVFDVEPLPPTHSFWRHPKITITPHASARTLRNETITQIAAKIRAVQSGVAFDALPGVVDAQRGY